MIKENVRRLQIAFNDYNINNDTDLPYKVLRYIADRIEANRSEIEKIISIYKSDITVDKIISIIKEEINKEYESLGKTIINEQGFLFAQVMTPVGIIAVEAYKPEEIIKYWIKAIKTRNAIAISAIKYNEYSVEALILVIIKEALRKYNIDENLVMYMPFEDYFYDYFDQVIYMYSEEGITIDPPKVEKNKISIENKGKKYVYIENEIFENEAQKNEDCEFIRGDVEEIIEKVKFAKGAVIYTEDVQKAYKFINLAQCDNVFVNAELSNTIGTLESKEELYKYKNIIIPVPQELIKKDIDKEKIDESKNEEEQSEGKESQEYKEKMMIEYKEGLWAKIKKRFKELFKM